jgi:protein-serine/threonine kinase
MADAVDLVSQCLEANANDRPTAAQVCRHRFILQQYASTHPDLAATGWTGTRGWEEAR